MVSIFGCVTSLLCIIGALILAKLGMIDTGTQFIISILGLCLQQLIYIANR